jgi:hypothetical protein
VQVETFRNRGPLETDQGREAARLVILVRGPGNIVPQLVVDPGSWGIVQYHLLRQGHLGEVGDQIEGGLSGSLATFLESLGPGLALRVSHDIGCAFLDVESDAHHV